MRGQEAAANLTDKPAQTEPIEFEAEAPQSTPGATDPDKAPCIARPHSPGP